MKELALTQLSVIDIRQDEVADFNIVAASANRFALRGSTTQIYTSEIVLETLSNIAFPYLVAVLDVPQERVLGPILAAINLHEIYDKSHVLKKQEMSLDALYSAAFSEKPILPVTLHAVWSPRLVVTDEQLLAVLTTHGACSIYAKKPRARFWLHKRADLTHFLHRVVYSTNKTPNLKSFNEYQEFVGKHWITACAWDERQCLNEQKINIFYVATACGEILGFLLPDNHEQEITIYARYQSELGRICYMKTFGNNFLFTSNIHGQVHLFKVLHDDVENSRQENIMIEPDVALWRQKDHMPCMQVVITAPNDNCFYLVMCKAAYIFVYCLAAATGKILAKKRSFVDGIKITGLDMLSNNEFILSTINSEIFQMLIKQETGENNTQHDMYIEIKDIDTKNLNIYGMEIKGVATTEHRNLLILMLQQNREFSSTKNMEYTKMMVCQIYKNDTLNNLNIMTVEPMNALIDYCVELRLNICNRQHLSSYTDFMRLSTLEFPMEFDGHFLQQLQLKWLIGRSFQFYQRMQPQLYAFLVSEESMEFLVNIIKIISMILRLQYLAKLSNLNPFQLQATSCIIFSCELLLNEFQLNISNGDNIFLEQMIKFTNIAISNFATVKEYLSIHENSSYKFTEMCVFCEEITNSKTLRCNNNHDIFRCCISQLQVPLDNKRYCPQCNASALDSDELLQQLLAPGEKIRCTCCRFGFTKT